MDVAFLSKTFTWIGRHSGPAVKLWNFFGSTFRKTVLRGYYSEERIAGLIQVWPSGEGQGLYFYKSPEKSWVSAWLMIVNHAPFPVEIDDVNVDVFVGGSIVKFLVQGGKKIAAHSNAKLFVEQELTTEQANRIEWQRSQLRDPPVGVSLAIRLDTEIRRVLLRRPEIATGNYQFVNFKPITTGSVPK